MKRLAVLLLAISMLGAACQKGNVFTLEPGQCFNDPGVQDEVSDVEIVDCAESHDNEVYHTFDISASSFPGESVVLDQAFDGCLGAFDAYVGIDFNSSALDVSALTPTSASWAQGDREVVCYLFDFYGERLVTSTRGTGI